MTPDRSRVGREAANLVCGVVILAAGASSRMGRPKLLLPWGETSVLGHLIGQWQVLQARQITVVHAEGDDALGAELDRLAFVAVHRIANPTAERGMFSSIQCAARWRGWNRELTHWAIVLGDQPHLREQTLRALLECAAAHPQQVCQPARNGRARHPVIVPAAVFGRVADSSRANLKQFLQNAAFDVALCPSDDAALDLDLDTPADYEKALRIFLNSATASAVESQCHKEFGQGARPSIRRNAAAR